MLIATSSTGSSGTLLALAGAVVLVGGIGFAVFLVVTRRKRRPNACAQQQEALDLAERAVRHWEAARNHLDAVARGRTGIEPSADDQKNAALMANAVEGLRTAIKHRDECQMDLIRCMASGATVMPVINRAPAAQPFFIPGADADPPLRPPRVD